VTDQQLISLCKQNDRRAQKALYDRYSKAMYTTAYRITGDFEWAGEALQDGFMRVYKHIADFEQRSTLGAWIKTIVVRAALQKVARRKSAFEAWPEVSASAGVPAFPFTHPQRHGKQEYLSGRNSFSLR